MSEIAKKESDANVAVVERTRNGVTFTPRFDILESGDELMLYGDLPGVVSEDLDVRFENEHLIIHGKVHPRHEGREHIYGEYDVGDFYREFRISEAVDPDKIAAELKNGVLKVHLPKAESLKPRRIEVKS